VTLAARRGATARNLALLLLAAVAACAIAADRAGAARPTISILDPSAISLDYGRAIAVNDAPQSFSVAVRNDAQRAQRIEVRVLSLVRSPGEAPLEGVFAEKAEMPNVEAGAVANITYVLHAQETAPDPGTYAGTLVAFGELGGVERRAITLTVTGQPEVATPAPDPVAGLTATTLPPVHLPATNYWPTVLGLSAGWLTVLGFVLALVALLCWLWSIPRFWRVAIAGTALLATLLLAPLATDDRTEPVDKVEIGEALVNPTVAVGSVGTVAGDNGDVGTLVVTKDSKLTAIGLHRAGSYDGKLDLNGAAAEGASDATVNVRDWWIFAALVITAGVAIGYWISRWFQRRRAANQLRVRIDDVWEKVAEDDSTFQQKAGGLSYGGYSLVPYAKARLRDATAKLDEDPDDTKPATAILDRLEAQIARMGLLREALRVLDGVAVDLAGKVRAERFALGDAERVAALEDAWKLLVSGLQLPVEVEDADGAAIKRIETEVADASNTVERVAELHDRIAYAVALARSTRVSDPPPDKQQNDDLDKHENDLRHVGRAILLTTNDVVLGEEERAILAPETAIRDIWTKVVKPDLEAEIAYGFRVQTLGLVATDTIVESRSLTVGEMKAFVIGPTAHREADSGDVDDLFEFRVIVGNPGEPVGVAWSFGDGSPDVATRLNRNETTLVVRHQFAEAKPVIVSLRRTDGLGPGDAPEILARRSVAVAGGKGRSARARNEFRRLDTRMTLASGAIAVGSGMLTLYFSDSGWGQPDDYLKALLWGSLVSEGLKYTAALATRLLPTS
jgi:hypothetical protein